MRNSFDHKKMLYSVEETCELLSISRAQLNRLIDVCEIGSVKIGKCRRITSKQLDEFAHAVESRSAIPLSDELFRK